MFERGGEESVLCNIEVKEFNRVDRTSQKLAQVSKKMDKGIDKIHSSR